MGHPITVSAQFVKVFIWSDLLTLATLRSAIIIIKNLKKVESIGDIAHLCWVPDDWRLAIADFRSSCGRSRLSRLFVE